MSRRLISIIKAGSAGVFYSEPIEIKALKSLICRCFVIGSDSDFSMCARIVTSDNLNGIYLVEENLNTDSISKVNTCVGTNSVVLDDRTDGFLKLKLEVTGNTKYNSYYCDLWADKDTYENFYNLAEIIRDTVRTDEQIDLSRCGYDNKE